MPGVTAGVSCDDETLVNLARGGDRSAGEELLLRHYEVAYRVACRLLGNTEDARDAVQDAVIKALAHLSDFDGRSGFKTWFLKIVHNTAIDSGRKRKRRPTLGLSDESRGNVEPSFEEDPDAPGLTQGDLRRILDEALVRLTLPIRTTFILFAESGLSYKEIAEIQDVPIGTVMSRLHYARHKLQSFLNLDEIEGI